MTSLNSNMRARFWFLILTILISLLISSVAIAQVSPWKGLNSPAARSDMALANDNSKSQLFLFGGVNGTNYFGDTWIYKNDIWQQINKYGPEARGRMAFCYMDDRSEVLVFGGIGQAGVFHDTWIFNGKRWQEVKGFSPGALEGSVLAYNSDEDYALLFGGKFKNIYFNEVWKYQAGKWSKVETKLTPSGRIKHSFVYDSNRREFVMFGGTNGNPLGDTWVLKGTTWTRIKGKSPKAREAHAAAFSAKNNSMILFGGFDKKGKTLNDTWKYKSNTRKWRKLKSSGPSARAGHSLVFDQNNERFILFGAWNIDQFGSDLWQFGSNRWVLLDKSCPAPRRGASLAYDDKLGKLVMFGGFAENRYFEEVWTYSQEDGWQELEILSGEKPEKRAFADMVYDPSRGKLILHGWAGNEYDTWTLDTSSGTWEKIASDCPQNSGAMAYYSKTGQIVLLAGGSEPWQTSKTYVLENNSWREVVTENSPGIRTLASMAYHPGLNKLVLYGGLGYSVSRSWPVVYSDTWTFDGVDWTKVEGSGPQKRYGQAIAWDPRSGKIIMQGGITIFSDYQSTSEYYGYGWSCLADTWEFDGKSWGKISNIGPVRYLHSVAYIPEVSRIVTFGGFSFGGIYKGNKNFNHNDLQIYNTLKKKGKKTDLAITKISISSSPMVIKGTNSIDLDVINNSNALAKSYSISYYFSDNPIISRDDLLIARYEGFSLVGGESKTENLLFDGSILKRLAGRTMYLIVIIDESESLNDPDVGNNLMVARYVKIAE